MISNDEIINACELLKKDKSTRIPNEELDRMINEYKKELSHLLSPFYFYLLFY